MLRLVLFLALSVFVARAFWKLVDNFMEGFSGAPHRGRVPPRGGVQMARCVVCGTFVVPDRAVTMTSGRTRVVFCSNACRDKYSARTA